MSEFLLTVWALADLHLALGVPEKKMDFFGEPWIDYTDKIEKNWKACVSDDDLVLIAGDISWAKRLEEAAIDLQWIHQLPGTKVIIRGNHDYWWTSLKKMQAVMPPSIHVVQNNSFTWNKISIAGARLWDSPEYNFSEYIIFKENPRSKKNTDSLATQTLGPEDEKIFERDLHRLELSLKTLDPNAEVRIAMTHYPPIGNDLKSSRASELLKKYKVDYCVFGHLHSLKPGLELFGNSEGVEYIFTACDYLNFMPVKVLD